jgi:hypothetical protein
MSCDLESQKQCSKWVGLINWVNRLWSLGRAQESSFCPWSWGLAGILSGKLTLERLRAAHWGWNCPAIVDRLRHLAGNLHWHDQFPKPFHLSLLPFLPINQVVSRVLRDLLITIRELSLGYSTRNNLMCGIYFAVGKMGQHSLVACSGDLTKAKEIFQKKWVPRNEYKKMPFFWI